MAQRCGCADSLAPPRCRPPPPRPPSVANDLGPDHLADPPRTRPPRRPPLTRPPRLPHRRPLTPFTPPTPCPPSVCAGSPRHVRVGRGHGDQRQTDGISWRASDRLYYSSPNVSLPIPPPSARCSFQRVALSITPQISAIVDIHTANLCDICFSTAQIQPLP